MVNQTPDEGCLSRATIGSRETSPISDKEIFRFPFNFQSKIPTLAETFRQLVSNLPYTLPSSVSCNPFGCHSYESCRGVYQQFPFWNSPLITHHWPAVLLKSATSAILESQS